MLCYVLPVWNSTSFHLFCLYSFSPATQDSLNTVGDGLADILIPFPVALLGDTSTELISSKVQENLERNYIEAAWQHGVEFSFYQGRTSVDTPFCLAQNRCRPLGGFSVWGSVGAFPSSKRSVMLATHLDSSAMFTDLAFGAEGTASGVIALLGAVHALGQVRDTVPALDKQILFAFFQGEEWERLGSRRFVFDLTNGCLTEDNNTCTNPPIYNLAWTDLDLSTVEEVIAVDQVGKYYSNDKENYFLHAVSQNGIADAMNISSGLGLNVSAVEGAVPPSPLDSFLESSGFQGVGAVLSGYNNQYENPFYRSRFDRRLSVNDSAVTELTKVATLLAQAAYRIAGGDPEAVSLVANASVVAELENCLTFDFSCDLVQEFLGLNKAQIDSFSFARNIRNSPRITPSLPPAYPGFYQPNAFLGPNINSLVPMSSHFVRNFAAYHTEPMLLPQEELDEVTVNNSCVSNLVCSLAQPFVSCGDTRSSSLACVRGKCMCVSTHFQDAYSPAINVTGGGYRIVNDTAEAIFADVPFSAEIPVLRLYQAAQTSTSLVLFIPGLVFTLLAIVFVAFGVPRLETTIYKLTEKLD